MDVATVDVIRPLVIGVLAGGGIGLALLAVLYRVYGHRHAWFTIAVTTRPDGFGFYRTVYGQGCLCGKTRTVTGDCKA